MSTHNICFRGEIRKIFTGYPLLSRSMRTYPKERFLTLRFKLVNLALFTNSACDLECWLLAAHVFYDKKYKLCSCVRARACVRACILCTA